MRNEFLKYAAVACVVMLGGCRFKGVESFKTATTPTEYNQVPGDKYGNGGVAYASAGTKPETRYGLGANPNSPDKVDPKLDRPAVGSGQQVGELGGEGAPGYGKSNAPANQGSRNVDSANRH